MNKEELGTLIHLALEEHDRRISQGMIKGERIRE